jgi:ankyrin repeat protein
LGNTKLFDEIQKKTTFDNSKNELTLLNLAIALPNQTEMIKHLLEKKDADPTLRDGLGRNALEMAAIHADNAEIIDLLVKHKQVNIDGCDKSGKTALHFAAASSNVVAARRLIELIQQI